MKKFACYLCAGLLLPSALLAEPLDLAVPKTGLIPSYRIYSIDSRNTTLAASLTLEQIVKRIEQAATRVEWPQDASGKRVYGVVKITITIHVDGTVVNIEPMKSGSIDDDALIQAATNIIYASAPFTPVMQEVFLGMDAIRFSRTFEFRRDKKPFVN